MHLILEFSLVDLVSIPIRTEYKSNGFHWNSTWLDLKEILESIKLKI